MTIQFIMHFHSQYKVLKERTWNGGEGTTNTGLFARLLYVVDTTSLKVGCAILSNLHSSVMARIFSDLTYLLLSIHSMKKETFKNQLAFRSRYKKQVEIKKCEYSWHLAFVQSVSLYTSLLVQTRLSCIIDWRDVCRLSSFNWYLISNRFIFWKHT